jgi:hypothetical protein
MKKLFLSLLAISSTINAIDLPKCDKCSIAKEYAKCSYYVEIKGDLSKSDSCLIYAQSMYEGTSYGRASWYYLVGKDTDRALDAAQKALKQKEYFVAEQLSEIFIIKNDPQNAKKYADLFKKSVPDGVVFVDKHLEILKRLYKDKFDVELAKKLLK